MTAEGGALVNPAGSQTPLMTPVAALAHALGHARRRLMTRRALEGAAATLPWSAGTLALLVATQALLGPRSPLALKDQQVVLLALVALLAPLAMAAVHGALAGRLGDAAVALLVDRGLDLRERATAAVALRAQPDASSWAARAMQAIGSRDVRAAVPLRPLPWRGSALAIAALAGAFLLPPWPTAEAEAAKEKDTRVVTAASKLEEEAKKAAEQLEEKGASEEAQQVLEDVRKAAQRAQLEPVTKEEALQELERLDQTAKREQERREAADAGSLQRALSSIEQATMKRDAARKATDAESEGLQQQLESLAKEFAEGKSFEDRDRQRMAARLRDAADALKASHPEVADKLEALADAIEKGDMKAAAEIAQELAQSAEMEQMSAEAATGEALDDARRMVQQAMAALGKAPTDAEIAAAQEAAGEGEGQGGTMPGDAPGQGRDRSGKAVLETDWGIGTTNEASPEFRITGRGQQAERQSSETSDWREAYEAMHESSRLDGTPGRNTRVRGRLGEGELVAVETRQVSEAAERATLPNLKVPASYARANEDALAREEVPSAYRDSVRKYFTSLDAPDKPKAAPAVPPKPKESP